ncbi:class I SAM-dependent methyltransferase [Candidatus Rariloculus sp.]|uniref:class I SAM-dependent methyltransferase n=1 Tax=Candidatus Rariloculus sp. TaxID=3101265 RepID=UPI003D1065DD
MAGSELQPFRQRSLGRFLTSWVRDPRAIGAVAPSSPMLARLMVRGLCAGARVVELGSGTGAVTQAILDTGVRECDLYLIEQDERFVDHLKRRFPGAATVQADATWVGEHLGELTDSVDFVISGLPLLLFSDARKRRLLTAAFKLLGAGGAFHQFTYGGVCPVSKRLLGGLELKASCLGFAAFNVPPAFVYRFEHA